MSAVGVSTEYHTEIIDGRQVFKPLPKKLHILVQTYLSPDRLTVGFTRHSPLPKG